MLEKEIIDNERIPQILEPSETTCPSCDSNIDSCCTAISSKAIVYGSGKLYKGCCFTIIIIIINIISVYCPDSQKNVQGFACEATLQQLRQPAYKDVKILLFGK